MGAPGRLLTPAALAVATALLGGTIPPALCLALLAPTCGVLVSFRVTAAALYDLRHRGTPRPGRWPRTAYGAHESRRPKAVRQDSLPCPLVRGQDRDGDGARDTAAQDRVTAEPPARQPPS